jgi:DNA polymerase III epsilon subunit-like protein
MQDIRTFVYFDLEATGLKSSGRPRVCEISLIAVNTSDILDLHKSLSNSISGRTNEDTIIQVETCSPRIVNKLTLCVYPMATIVPFVSSMTGLDNYNLTGQSKFDRNIGNLLNIFLSCLPSPVCLVAHNGSQYDFPLLKAEMEKAGTKLGSQILCVDSYFGIKSILKNRQQIGSELKAVTELANAGEFDKDMMEDTCAQLKTRIESDRVKNLSSCSKTLQGNLIHHEADHSISAISVSTVSKHKNESTPTRSISLLYPKCRPKKEIRRKKEINYADKSKYRKKLEFSDCNMPTSFSLINLHKHFFGCPPNKSHGAEVDCLALMRITAVLGNDWLEWAQQNCTQFEKCEVMWSMPRESNI